MCGESKEGVGARHAAGTLACRASEPIRCTHALIIVHHDGHRLLLTTSTDDNDPGDDDNDHPRPPMSSKHRHAPSASSPSSKLPKFLQSKQTRDRSKSINDSAQLASSSSSSSTPSGPAMGSEGSSSSSSKGPHRLVRNNSQRLAGVKEQQQSQPVPVPVPALPPSTGDDAELGNADFSIADDGMDEPPVIIEPVSPRPRTRSERPLSSSSDNHQSMNYYSSSHSSSRLTDLPTRLSGWFQHTFNTSSTDLSLPNLLTHPPQNSPKGKTSALLTAAKHGKGHLDKAMRYLLDSDATPDGCTDVIWLLGVQHPGYEPPPPLPNTPPSSSGRRSNDSRRSPSFRSSTSSSTSPESTTSHSLPPSSYSARLYQAQAQSQSPSSQSTIQQQQISAAGAAAIAPNNWPPVFYSDFTSRVWLTYRSHFQPIRDSTLTALESEQASMAGAGPVFVASSPPTKKWGWPGSGEKGWTSDTGWGCMLRTGQSLLANSLLHLHLGRGASSVHLQYLSSGGRSAFN